MCNLFEPSTDMLSSVVPAPPPHTHRLQVPPTMLLPRPRRLLTMCAAHKHLSRSSHDSSAGRLTKVVG